jgi:hypothetical protein
MAGQIACVIFLDAPILWCTRGNFSAPFALSAPINLPTAAPPGDLELARTLRSPRDRPPRMRWSAARASPRLPWSFWLRFCVVVFAIHSGTFSIHWT